MTNTFVVNSAGKSTIVKDDNANLDYTFDWTTWLTDIGDTIVSSTVTADAGVTLSNKTNTTMKVTVFVAGGTIGGQYQVNCQIVTAGGRTDERSFYINVKET